MPRLLLWIASKFPTAVIERDGEPYLYRTYLWRGWPCHVYLHRFVGSDPDEALHDHPWEWAFSFILSGRYWEKRYSTDFSVPHDRRIRHGHVNGLSTYVVRREAGDRYWLKGTTYHRVLLDPGTTVWTLFFTGRRVKTWGFARPEGKEVITQRTEDKIQAA